jgi:hypothetical protein
MAVTIKVQGSVDRVIELGGDAQLAANAVDLVVEESRIYPQAALQPQEVAIGGSNDNVAVEPKLGTWHYAMIDNIEEVFEGTDQKGLFVVADCIPLTYFEAHATKFAAFYPVGVDDVQQFGRSSSSYVYRADNSTNEKEQLRNLRATPKNSEHRVAVKDLLSATDRLRIVRLKLPNEGLPDGQKLNIQEWHLFNLADDGIGLEAEVVTHAQIARGVAAPPQPGETFVQEIIFLTRNGPTARRLSRVISLDFVADIDFGSEGNPGDPPLTPVIVPTGPGAIDEEAEPLSIVVKRVDGAVDLPLVVLGSRRPIGSAVTVTFDRAKALVIPNLQPEKKVAKQVQRPKRQASPKAKKSQSISKNITPLPFNIYEDPEPIASSSRKPAQEQPLQQPKMLTGSPKRKRPALANISNANKNKNI